MSTSDHHTTPHDKVSKKKRVVIIIALLSIVILIQGIKIYVDNRELATQKDSLVSSNEELISTMSRLHEIEVELNQSIEEVERLGGDVAELEKAKAEVEADLRNTHDVTGRNIQQLKEKVEGYEQLLKLKDKELERLKSINKELYTENITLKTSQNELSDSIIQLSKNTDKLVSKVALASRLKVENMTIIALNAREKALKAPFRSKKIKKLKVTFNIAENKIAPIEGKKIFIRVVDPHGQTIFDVASGSGTFIQDGKEEFYTNAQDILFDNTLQKMIFFYQKNSLYNPGIYRLEALTDDYLMGQSTFEVK